MTETFLVAAQSGSVTELLAVLAPDVAVLSDGGGVVPAARAGLHGAERVARALAGFVATGAVGQLTVTPILVNGDPGVVLTEGSPLTVVVIEPMLASDGVTPLVKTDYAQASPVKLASAFKASGLLVDVTPP